jgi:hypothetical protein
MDSALIAGRNTGLYEYVGALHNDQGTVLISAGNPVYWTPYAYSSLKGE